MTLVASVFGFVVQLLLAQRYGVGVEVDAYLFSISLPTFLAGVISAMLSFNLIPRLIAVKSDTGLHQDLMGSILIVLTALSILLVLCIFSGMIYWKNHLLPAGSKIQEYHDLPLLILLSCAVGGAQIMQGCISSMLNSEKKFIQNAILTLIPYIGMVALMLGLDKVSGIITVAIGLLLGTLSAILIGISLLRTHLFPLPWKRISWTELWKIAQSSIYTALAMTCFSAYSIVDAFWGPRAGDGTLATLGYAQRLVIAVGNLAVAGPSAVLVPHFAEFLRDKNHHGFMKLMYRTLLVVSAVAISVALFLSVFSIEIVSLLFGYGAFGSAQISAVASTIVNLTPGMVAMLLSVIGMRVLFCFEGSQKSAAMMGLGWTAGYFVASSFVHQLGAVGIALAYSAVWLVSFFTISFLLYQKTRCFNAR